MSTFYTQNRNKTVPVQTKAFSLDDRVGKTEIAGSLKVSGLLPPQGFGLDTNTRGASLESPRIVLTVRKYSWYTEKIEILQKMSAQSCIGIYDETFARGNGYAR